MSELVIVKVEQGSPEWHELRKGKRTASETPAVMGTSKFQGPADVFDRKTGESTFSGNVATRHGSALEPLARASLFLTQNIDGDPVVGVRGDYLASLDVLSPEGDLVDIKCPYTGERSGTWKAAVKGEIEPGYADQLEHQYRVFLPERVGLYVYLSDERTMFIRYTPNEQRWGEIQRAWDAFWELLQKGERPSSKDRRSDVAWLRAAENYAQLIRELRFCEEKTEAARKELVELADGKPSEGCGVRVNFIQKVGTVDLKRALATVAPNLDLEPFRKEGRTEARVEVVD